MNSKKSSTPGLGIYLTEEIGDARLRASQLKGRVDEALGMIQQSPKKDHFFEVAGHLIQEVPELMVKLEASLASAAMAVAKWQGEELEGQVHPDKIKELEDALADTRVKKVIKSAKGNPVKPSQVIEQLRKLASSQDGTVDLNALVDLIRGLGSDVRVTSADLDVLADTLADTQKPSRVLVASSLKSLVTAAVGQAYDQVSQDYLSAVRQCAQRALVFFNNGNEKRAVAEVQEMLTSISFVLESYGATDASQLIIRIVSKLNTFRRSSELEFYGNDVATEVFPAFLEQAKKAKTLMDSGHQRTALFQFQEIVGGLQYLMDSMGQSDISTYCAHLVLQIGQLRRTVKQARFEEGKPADPTENLSEEDAKKWDEEHDKNKDNFKEAKAKKKPVATKKTEATKKKESWTKAKSLVPKTNKNKKYSGDEEGDSDKESGTKARSLVPKINRNKKYSRFEEGESADPTKDMSEEDADKWKDNTDKYEDKFKKEASLSEADKLIAKMTNTPHTKKQCLKMLEEAFEAKKITSTEHREIESEIEEMEDDGDFDKTAMIHDTDEAKKKYLQKHPGADPSKHTVKEDNSEYRAKKPLKEKNPIVENSRRNHLKDKYDHGELSKENYNKALNSGRWKNARFEEGESADPTENMSEEDAKTWHEEHDKNKDNFKSASKWKLV